MKTLSTTNLSETFVQCLANSFCCEKCIEDNAFVMTKQYTWKVCMLLLIHAFIKLKDSWLQRTHTDDPSERRAVIFFLYPFRKSIMRSTGANSLARRRHLIPPSFPCMCLLMLNWWVRYSWAPLPPGEWVCYPTPGMEACQTMVREHTFV